MNITVNSPVCGLRVASIGTGLVGLAHLGRVFLGFQIHIGSHPVPMWMSGAAFVVLAALSFWLWKLSTLINPIATPPPAPPAKPATP